MTTKITGDTGIDKVQDGTITQADFDPALFAFTHGQSGSQALPNGLLIKWGTTPTAADEDYFFPVPFPTICYAVTVTPTSDVVFPANALFAAMALAPTKDKFYLQKRYFSAASGVIQGSQSCFYIAIGK